MKTRTHFWAEAVYSETGCTIPQHIQRGFETKKPSIKNIVGELIRETGYCGHVQYPQPPVHVFGLDVDQLRRREKTLYENAAKISRPYMRGDVEFKRRQQKSEPILMMVVVSYPEPSMFRTNERDKWERRVIRLARVRWRDNLKGAYAHVDENYYHLHLWVDDDGRPVKHLHYGYQFASAAKKANHFADRKTLADAYKAGVTCCQDWVHKQLGKHMGWARMSDAPRPRLARGEAARLRQRELEEREELAAALLEKGRRDSEQNRCNRVAIEADARLVAEDREAWQVEKQRQKDGVRAILTKLYETSSVISNQASIEEKLRGLGLDVNELRSAFKP
jgi:hypothetical protein